MSRRQVLLLALCAAFLCLPAASAWGSGFIFENPGLYIYTGGEEGSQISVSDDGANFLFTDSGGLDSAMSGDCTQLSPTSASCDAGGGNEQVEVDDRGGDDTINTAGVGAGHDVSYRGGAGVDTFIGHDGFDNIVADDGNAEDVDCGGGDDQANTDPGDRVVNCETVTQNEPLLSMGPASAAEGQGVQFTLSLNAPAKKDFTVDYALVNGTTEDSDFSATGPRPSGTVTFHTGDGGKTVTIPTNDDTYFEPDQTFTLKLSNPQPPFAVRFTNSEAKGTITSDDTQPTVSIADAADVDEGESSMFAVTLDHGSDSPVTVAYSLQNGTASDADYTGPAMGSALITFTPHETTHTVMVPIVDDSESEGRESFTAHLSDVGGATIGTDTASGTITDANDTPTLGISGGTATEGSPLTFTVTLSHASQSTVSVDFATSDGSAHAPADYTSTSGAFTFAPGEMVKTFTVDTAGDDLDEDDKTVHAGLSNATNAPIAPGTASGTIADDDALPVLAISGGSATEGGSITFTVTKTGPTERTVSAAWATSDGTAHAPGDYTGATGTVTFAPGETVKTFTVDTAQDSVDEDNEGVAATLSAPSNATIGTHSDGTITDDDASPTLDISGGLASEGGTLSFLVTKTGPTERTVTVDFATSDGTAHAPGDYTAKSGTVTIAPGDTYGFFTVDAIDDNVDEVDETLSATMSNPSNASITTATFETTIFDEDDPPVLAISGGSATEGGAVTFTVTKTGATERTVSAAWATSDGTAHSPGDYTGATGTVTFAPGETVKTFTVAAAQDSVDEDTEGFGVTLSSSVNATIDTPSANATILDDDDPPVLAISGGSATEGGPVTFTVTKTGATAHTVTVDYATGGGTGDYTAKSGTLSFAPGDTVKTFAVDTAGDGVDEDSKTVGATLSTPSNATIGTASASGTIVDDDDSPVLAITGSSATEGGPVTFTVTKTGATERTASATWTTSDGTAHSPGDYGGATGTGTGTVTFAAGETVKTFTVATAQDSVDEDNEGFAVTLSTPSNATIGTASASGTIVDDDDSPVLAITGSSATEGGVVTFTVTKTGATERAVTVDYATGGGSGDYTAKSGTLTFAPGDAVKTFAVDTAGDSVDEDSKTVGATLSNPSNATLGTASANGTIVDDDAAPVLSISGGSATEGGAVTFTVTKTGGTEHAVTADYATGDGTAKQPGDYASAAGALTFAPGEASKTFDVATTSDSLDGEDEAFTATLSSPANATIGTATATGTITDGNDPPAVSVADAAGANEGDSGTHKAAFSVTLSGASAKTVTVDAATTAGTAEAGSDFDSYSGTLTFAPGETVKTVEVDVHGDTTVEQAEDFSLDLSSAKKATIADGHGVALIVNDDHAPVPDSPTPDPPTSDPPTPVRAKPTIIFSVANARDRKAPFRYVLTGRVKLPEGTPSSACHVNAPVTARVTRVATSRFVTARRTTLRDNCTFRLRLAFVKRPGNGRLRVSVSYAGNTALTAAKSKRRSLRAG